MVPEILPSATRSATFIEAVAIMRSKTANARLSLFPLAAWSRKASSDKPLSNVAGNSSPELARRAAPTRRVVAARMEGATMIGSVKGALRFIAERGVGCCILPEHAARQEIRSIDGHEIFYGDLEIGSAVHDAVCLTQASAVQCIADGAGVREVRLLLAGVDVARESLPPTV